MDTNAFLEAATVNAARWQRPISEENPGGDDAKWEPEFLELRDEIDKLSSTTGGKTDWARVLELGDRLLVERSKDLRAAIWFTCAKLTTESWDGYAEGLIVVRSLLRDFWEESHPSPRRVRSRIMFVDWLIGWTGTQLEQILPFVGSRVHKTFGLVFPIDVPRIELAPPKSEDDVVKVGACLTLLGKIVGELYTKLGPEWEDSPRDGLRISIKELRERLAGLRWEMSELLGSPHSKGPGDADIGVGERFDIADLEEHGWRTKKLIWAKLASATCQYQTARNVCGIPGSIPGRKVMSTWSPTKSWRPAECLSVIFEREAPAAEAIWIFEGPGAAALFAISAVLDDKSEETLWHRKPDVGSASPRVLEVKLPEPRRFDSIKLWIDSESTSSYYGNVAIDAVAIVTQEPLIGSQQGYKAPPLGRGRRWTPTEFVQRALQDPTQLVWADQTDDPVEDYPPDSEKVDGPPNIYPHHKSHYQAWHPSYRKDLVTPMDLMFPPSEAPTKAIWIFETFRPGALFAVTIPNVDDTEEVIWRGEPSYDLDEAQVLEVLLDAPRHIDNLRIWLQAGDENEIDAVALVLADR